MAKTIKFIQGETDVVKSFEKEFTSFQEAKDWVLEDKREGYGDILAYGGRFKGLTPLEIKELESLTMEDSLVVKS